MAAMKSEYRMALETGAQALTAAIDTLSPQKALQACVERIVPGEICVVSSFGTESAIILHMVSRIDPDIPVLFIDTGKLFEETLTYRDELATRFGLKNIQTLHPNPDHLKADDPDGNLHQTKPDLCCHVRKTLPLIQALRPYKVWVSGRKRYHGAGRTQLDRIEIQDGKLKFNPLYNWDAPQLRDYAHQHDLPDHPLLKENYLSVGCLPCTVAVTSENNDPRAGRWPGQDKTECGIHIDADGTIKRQPP